MTERKFEDSECFRTIGFSHGDFCLVVQAIYPTTPLESIASIGIAVRHGRETGIPSDELPRISERFHPVENARGRTHERAGIGLALVQELVSRETSG